MYLLRLLQIHISSKRLIAIARLASGAAVVMGAPSVMLASFSLLLVMTFRNDFITLVIAAILLLFMAKLIHPNECTLLFILVVTIVAAVLVA